MSDAMALWARTRAAPEGWTREFYWDDHGVIVIHRASWSGNERTPTHAEACAALGLPIDALCESRQHWHISFTPGHPLVVSGSLDEVCAVRELYDRAADMREFAGILGAFLVRFGDAQ